MPDSPEAILILTTAGDEDQARQIATHLVESRLVACVNVIPRIRSVYRWEGKLVEEEELLLICKTSPSRFEPVRKAIRKIHTYDCPEVICVEVPRGDPDYLGWLHKSTTL